MTLKELFEEMSKKEECTGMDFLERATREGYTENEVKQFLLEPKRYEVNNEKV